MARSMLFIKFHFCKRPHTQAFKIKAWLLIKFISQYIKCHHLAYTYQAINKKSLMWWENFIKKSKKLHSHSVWQEFVRHDKKWAAMTLLRRFNVTPILKKSRRWWQLLPSGKENQGYSMPESTLNINFVREIHLARYELSANKTTWGPW